MAMALNQDPACRLLKAKTTVDLLSYNYHIILQVLCIAEFDSTYKADCSKAVPVVGVKGRAHPSIWCLLLPGTGRPLAGSGPLN